jgi:membrane protein implicated in regulation of membrane protease activity
MELLQKLVYWHWLVLAITLMTLEIFSPGIFMLWLGLAAGITGLLVWLMPEMNWQIQFLIFVVFSLISILAVRQWMKKRSVNTDQPYLNRRGEQYIGRIFTLEEAMINGQGKIRVDDTTWKIRGDDDCPSSAKVKVTGVDGVILLVQNA